MNDLRIAFRQLLKNPGFTAVAVLTLALGIGANTAIFSVVHGVLLKPLPYPGSERLVRLSEAGRDWTGGPISYPNFMDWKAQQTSFEHPGLYRAGSFNLTSDGEPLRVTAGEVAADVFSALRVQPILGRVFTPDEDKPGGPRLAVLSHALWQSRFGGDPAILDKTISLNGQVYTVLGVMPRGFDFPENASLWTPVELGFSESFRQARGERPGHKAIARLKPGLTLQQAQAELNGVATRLAQQFPGANKNRGVGIEYLLDTQVGKVRRALWILLGAVALVLLIASANVANLLLARAATRQKEMAVRVALGAGRWRIIRQLLAESLLLAAAGGLAGVLLAHWSLRLIAALGQGSLPRVNEIHLDGTVLLFSASVALVIGILFGLAPAMQSSRPNLHDMLKDTSRGTTGGRARLRHGLIVAEVALTLVLLAGAGLLLKSFHNLLQVNPGFSHEQVLSFQLSLPRQKYPTPAARSAFYEGLLGRVRALPGVQSASLASQIPFDKKGWQTSFAIEDRPEEGYKVLEAHTVAPDYFRTMGIPLLRGRTFTEQDNRDHIRGTDREQSGNAALNVIAIDEEFVRRHFPNEDPIGKRIRLPWSSNGPLCEIIGVVKRVREDQLGKGDGLVQGYLPFLQRPDGGMSVVVKAALPPGPLIASLRQQVLAMDSELPLYDVRTMSAMRADNIAPDRLNLTLLGIFAAVALALAVIGLYGVLAYAVTQRQREIGVRMALGAQRRDVLKLVVGHGMRLALLGVAVGLIGSLALTRVLQNLLYEVKPSDPLTFVAVTSLLCVIVLLACYFPARRATRVDPMVALRYE